MFGLLFARGFRKQVHMGCALLPLFLLIITQWVRAEQQEVAPLDNKHLVSSIPAIEEVVVQGREGQENPRVKESQVEQEIRREVTRHLEKKAKSLTQGLANSQTVVSIQMPTANSTERLSPCTDSLVLEDNQKGAGRQRVKVTCNGFRRWSVYVGGDIALEVPVLVTTRPLKKGDTVTVADVTHRLQNVSKSRGDYMTNVAALKGQALRRSISAGTVLDPEFFERTAIIRQGDRVAIVSGHRGFRITVTGVAQQDGAMGETIRVKNSSSGKVLTGTVEGAGEVAVP